MGYSPWGCRVGHNLATEPTTNKDLPCSIWNSAQSYVVAWMGGESEGGWIHVYIYMAESLCCPPETITALSIGYAPIQNKKFNFKKKGF